MIKGNWLRGTLTGIAVLCSGITSHAQNAPSCLPFDNTLKLAASNDPAVRTARANLERAEADLQEARSLRRPQLSTFTRFGAGDTGLVDSQIENQFGLRASQRIIDFGDSRLAREAAREDIAAQESLVLDARGSAALDAGMAFIDWLEATDQLVVTEERIDYFTRQLNAIDTLLPSGGATRLERAEVAAEQASAEALRFEFEFRRDQAATRLAISTGDRGHPCGAEASIAENTAEGLDSDSLINFISDAVSINPEIEALRRTEASLDATARREARGRLPVIDVVGIASYGSQNFDGDFDLQTRIGVNVSVPLFTGNALVAQRRRASAQAARASGELASARRQLREAIEVTWRRGLLLEAQTERRKAINGFKSDEFAAAEIEYEQGLRTLPALTETRLELEEAALAEIASRFDLQRERLRLLALSGRLSGVVADEASGVILSGEAYRPQTNLDM
ncbi:MAG: TolC family protein [Pseudomonadota bacterium]